MKNQINQEAWAILTHDEKTAITLKLGFSKSTWQAGEVMEKAHYKFLEIEARAKFYLKTFTEHYELYGELIPSYIRMDTRFRKYLMMVIGNRSSIKDAVEFIDDHEYNIQMYRHDLIAKEMEKLVNSKHAINQNFAVLVFDFDRWNNFRILPASIQEPSAFKRRNKNNEKKNIKNLLTLNPYQIKVILDRYQIESGKMLFMPIPSKDRLNKGYGIIKVLDSDATIKELSRFGFYLFTQEEHAEDFYDHIKGYSFNRKELKNNCKAGQTFWPKFRLLIKSSINYNNIAKRIASRKFLESAMRDMDQNYLYPKREKDPLKKGRNKKEKGYEE